MSQVPKTRWKIVWFCVIAGAIAAAHVGKLPPAMPEIRADLGLGLVVGGWVVSAFSIVGMAAAIGIGIAADAVGLWRMCLAGLLFLAVGSTLGAAAPEEWTLLFSRVLEGLGFICVAVSAPSVIVRITAPHDWRLALGFWGTYMPAGLALMMLFTPVILELAGWRFLWLFVAALTVAWIAVMVLGGSGAPRDSYRPEPGVIKANVRLTASAPGPWILAVCFGLYTIPWLALMVWMPSFMIETRGISTATAAALTALVVVLNVPGNLIAGWLLHRGASHWALIVIAAGTMGLSSAGIFSDALPDGLRYASCLAFSLIGGMLPTAVLSGAPIFAPSGTQVGITNGLLVQGSNTGQVIGPPALAAAVLAAGSWEGSLWVMVTACCAGALLGLLLRPFEKRRRDAALDA
jgi:MFS family permease